MVAITSRPTLPFNSIMVVGVNTRPIVKSAKALGLKTIAVDCFGDVDLREFADAVFSLGSTELRVQPKSSKGSSLFQLSLQALETHDVDAILLTSGMEHNSAFIGELGKRAKIIGNDTTRLETCKNKEKLFHIADKLGIPYPRTRRVRRRDEALEVARDIGYPVVLKPAVGGGGIGIKLVKSPDELERSFRRVLLAGDNESLYVQQYIRGIDASTSILSNGDEAKCLTVNEQLIGDKRLGVPRPFGYCGNVIPLNKPEFEDEIAEASRSICKEIGLVGSNGVDFVVSDQPYLMEINPRFQNTIDCVEGLLGINLVEEHIRSCKGELNKYRQPDGYSVKLILYAKGDFEVPNLTKFRDIVDIPQPESIIRKGKPVCCVLKFGKSRHGVIAKAYDSASKVYRKLRYS
ncbi:MAG: ATP-grasp domain-containing protein [Candidatus Hadarchaeaceae archaeon]